MKAEKYNLGETLLCHVVYFFSLICLITGVDAFLLLNLLRAASALALTILSVHTWRTICGRYSHS